MKIIYFTVATLCGLLLGANGLRMRPSTRCATAYDGCRIDPVRREKVFSQTQSFFIFFEFKRYLLSMYGGFVVRTLISKRPSIIMRHAHHV